MVTPRQHLSFAYLMFPICSMVLVLPPVAEMPPVSWPSNANVWQFALVSPFYAGLVAGPGYLYAWVGHHDRRRLPLVRRIWVGTSIVLATPASAAGTVASLPTGIVPPFAAASFVCSILLFLRFTGVLGGRVATDA